MGCGGSKEEVATGNTVPPTLKSQPQDSNAEKRRKKNKKSTVVKEETAEECGAVDDTKDIVTATVSSPDHYFSPRKDESFQEIDSNEGMEGGDHGSVVAPVVVTEKVEEGDGGSGSVVADAPAPPVVLEQVEIDQQSCNTEIPKVVNSDAGETIVEKKALEES